MAGSGVAAGAFGAHSLKETLDAPMLTVFETAVRYQMYHALGLCIIACIWKRHDARRSSVAGWCFALGIALFSGSLYGVSLTGIRWLGAVTPVGGLALIAGWTVLALDAWRAIGQTSRD